MAVRVEDTMSLFFDFIIYNPETGKNQTKRVTLQGIHQNLTDDQYYEVAQKLDSLLKHPAAAYGLITREHIIPGNKN